MGSKVKLRSKSHISILEYNCIFMEEESGGYSVWVPDLPGCASQGETFEEAKKNIQEAIELYLEDEPTEVAWHVDPRRQFVAPVSISLHA
jgi:predicted RNase H-like HicB family nuclease